MFKHIDRFLATCFVIFISVYVYFDFNNSNNFKTITNNQNINKFHEKMISYLFEKNYLNKQDYVFVIDQGSSGFYFRIAKFYLYPSISSNRFWTVGSKRKYDGDIWTKTGTNSTDDLLSIMSVEEIGGKTCNKILVLNSDDELAKLSGMESYSLYRLNRGKKEKSQIFEKLISFDFEKGKELIGTFEEINFSKAIKTTSPLLTRIYLNSWGCELRGNKNACIKINDSDISIINPAFSIKRGLNIATLDQSGKLESFGSYDTFDNKTDYINFLRFIDSIPENRVVLLIVQDEASKLFDEEGDRKIASVGGTISLIGKFRNSYALIGIKRKEKGITIKEKWSDTENAEIEINFSEILEFLKNSKRELL